jgi:hypothetical protein
MSTDIMLLYQIMSMEIICLNGASPHLTHIVPSNTACVAAIAFPYISAVAITCHNLHPKHCSHHQVATTAATTYPTIVLASCCRFHCSHVLRCRHH